MKRLRIDHVTEYRFVGVATLLRHRLMLRPRESHAVRIASSELEIQPSATLRWQRDALDNSVALATFGAPTSRLRIASSIVIEHYEDAPLDFLVDDHAVMHPFSYAVHDARLLTAFLTPGWPDDGASVRDWLAQLGLQAGSLETFVLLNRLNAALHEGFRYEAREEPGVQSPAQTLARQAGSCRDFAALFMEACRQLGLASRFVSGYLHDPTSVWQGGGATHAWAEVYLPGPGWKGFDPTCNLVAGSDHIAVAVARHPELVPPVSGSFMGSPQRPTLAVSVRVRACPG